MESLLILVPTRDPSHWLWSYDATDGLLALLLDPEYEPVLPNLSIVTRER